jgi:glyoxylase-like metal-dependent hydrolase (beta-lactamase superfamily II)
MGTVRQLLDTGGQQLTYLFADPVTRHAALIDPTPGNRLAIERLLRGLGLQLDYVVATHRHHAQWAEGEYFRTATGARLALHEASPATVCDLPLRDGDRLYVGEEVLDVLYAPGHTPDSLWLRNRERLWVGDTLYVSGVAAVQGPEAELPLLYESISHGIYSLADDTLIYPAHAVAGRRITTVAQERDANEDLPAGRSFEQFTRAFPANEDWGPYHAQFAAGTSLTESHHP